MQVLDRYFIIIFFDGVLDHHAKLKPPNVMPIHRGRILTWKDQIVFFKDICSNYNIQNFSQAHTHKILLANLYEVQVQTKVIKPQTDTPQRSIM